MSEPTPELPPPRPRARLTLGGEVSLLRPGEGTDGRPVRFVRWLATDEQPYAREVRVTEEWVPLDCGWLKGGAGFLVLENPRERPQRVPTAEESAACDAKVVEVGMMLPAAAPGGRPLNMWDEGPAPPAGPVACWLVPPGEALPATPADANLLFLRCRKGEAKVRLWLVPR